MTSNQAITSGSQSHKADPSVNRLNRNLSFSNSIDVPSNLSDPAFFNLFQDLFQKPPAVQNSIHKDDHSIDKQKAHPAKKEEPESSSDKDKPNSNDRRPEKYPIDPAPRLPVDLPVVPLPIVQEYQSISEVESPTDSSKPAFELYQPVTEKPQVGEEQVLADVSQSEQSAEQVGQLVDRLVQVESGSKQTVLVEEVQNNLPATAAGEEDQAVVLREVLETLAGHPSRRPKRRLVRTRP